MCLLKTATQQQEAAECNLAHSQLHVLRLASSKNACQTSVNPQKIQPVQACAASKASQPVDVCSGFEHAHQKGSTLWSTVQNTTLYCAQGHGTCKHVGHASMHGMTMLQALALAKRAPIGTTKRRPVCLGTRDLPHGYCCLMLRMQTPC